jgi:hypothetical protein
MTRKYRVRTNFFGAWSGVCIPVCPYRTYHAFYLTSFKLTRMARPVPSQCTWIVHRLHEMYECATAAPALRRRKPLKHRDDLTGHGHAVLVAWKPQTAVSL